VKKVPHNGALFGRELRAMAPGMRSGAADRAKKETVMAQGFGSAIPALEILAHAEKAWWLRQDNSMIPIVH
jgi:hypothetical protein